MDNQIDDMLQRLFSRTGVKLTEIGWELAAEESEITKGEIKALIQAEVLKARIDELESVPRYKYDDVWVLDGGKYYRKRIASLQAQASKKESGQEEVSGE